MSVLLQSDMKYKFIRVITNSRNNEVIIVKRKFNNVSKDINQYIKYYKIKRGKNMYQKQFNGSKFFYVGSSYKYDDFGNKIEKKEFRMTKKYKEFLDEKRCYEEQLEVEILKQKLEWQKETYGDVDELDFQCYLRLIQKDYNK